LIKGSLVTLECGTEAIHEAGDHQILVGLVRAAEVGTAKEGKAALMYFRGKYGTLG
jgi:flavin reductase (DIM6/NTAB) family NADH-FMN oxidoreductase RutF